MGNSISVFWKQSFPPNSKLDDEITSNTWDRPVSFDNKPKFMKQIDQPELTASTNSQFAPKYTEHKELMTYRDFAMRLGPLGDDSKIDEQFIQSEHQNTISKDVIFSSNRRPMNISMERPLEKVDDLLSNDLPTTHVLSKMLYKKYGI